jgi:uncharacterized protein YciI
MKLWSFASALILAAPLALGAQAAKASAAPMTAPPGFEVPKDMTPYFLAIYVAGPKHLKESPEQMELAKQHLKFIRRMIEQKKYMFAGPLTDNGEMLGVAVVAAASIDEAKQITSGDPAIAAGHMTAQLHPAMLPSFASLVIKY